MDLIILDRDGVINEDSDDFIKSPEEWIPIPGSPEAIARLNQAGYHVVVSTNQSGIGRQLFPVETLAQIHKKMHQTLQQTGASVDAIFFCPHLPTDECECRKPKSGMLHDIRERLGQDLEKRYVVGDSLRDLQSAQQVDAQPILVKTGKGQKTQEEHKEVRNIPTFDDLSSFVDALLDDKLSAETS